MSFWKFHSRFQVYLLILALGLAFLAQYIFTGEFLTRNQDSITWAWEPRYTLATIMLIAALGCAAWAFRKGPDEQPYLSTTLRRSELTDLDFYALTGAASCYAASLLIYWSLGENWLVQLLWLASIGCLVLPLWYQSRLVADEQALNWLEWMLLAGLTLVAFGLRYWRLTEIPNQIDHDIPLMGWFAGQLIETGNYNWIGTSASAHLLSYDQSLAWSMRLFGLDQYGLVMKSVLLGTLTVPLLFLFVRELFDWRVGLIAAALLAFNYTHIHFSRLLFGPSATFFAVLTFYCIFHGLRVQRKLWFALAGISLGFGLLLYDSARVIPVLTVGLVVWRALWDRTVFLANRWKWITFGAGILVGFGPMLGYAIGNFEDFLGRGNSVMIWTPTVWEHTVTVNQTDSVAGVLLAQVRSTFLALHLYGDGSPHFAFPRPMVAALTAALFVIGLGYCLWRIRDARYFSLLTWVGATFVLGGVLTYDPPYWPHLNIAIPAICAIAALAMIKVIDEFSAQVGKFGSVALRLSAAGVIVFTGFNNWTEYYDYVENNADPAVRAARFINTLPKDYQIYLVNAPVNWDGYVFKFLNQSVAGQNISSAAIQATPPAPAGPLVFLVYNDPGSLRFLQSTYPAGQLALHFSNTQLLVFASYQVEPPGYAPPALEPFNPLRLPGWWLVLAALVGLLAWVGYGAWQAARARAA